MSFTMYRFVGVILLSLSSPIYAADDAAVRVLEEHGFINLDIPIERVITNNGVVQIIARGHVDAGNIGLELDFPYETQAATLKKSSISFGTARMQSIGTDSDNFIGFLARKYGVSTPAKMMLKSVDAETGGLGDSGTDEFRGKKDMKFFFYADGPKDRYAELYVNIDFDNRILEIHEKDPYYRKGIILALTKGQ